MMILVNSCEKPKGDEECIWEKETTDMTVHLGKMETIDSYELSTYIEDYDTCKYNLLCIKLFFESKYLPYEVCSSPSDSLVGNIKDISLICINDYNDLYKIGDTINPIIKMVYQTANGMMIENRILLESYLSTKPICVFHAYLFLNEPPDTISKQSFNIIYKETDGTVYTDATQIIYIRP